MSVGKKLMDDWGRRLKSGEPIYSNILEHINYILMNSEDMWAFQGGDKIKIRKKKQIISAEDPYGEEDWDD